MYVHNHNKYHSVILGSAPINNGMAVVTVNSLHCGVTYNITVGGMYNNGTLVGPGSSYDVTTGICRLATSEFTYMHTYIQECVQNCIKRS